MKCNCRSHSSFLTAKGLKETALQTSLEGLEPLGVHGVELVGVDASRPDRDRDLYEFISDLDIDEQERRFHNGS